MSAEMVAKMYADRDYDEVTLDGMRKVIAARLSEAKQTIPHFYLRRDIQLDALLKFRSMKRDAEDASGPVWARDGDTRVTRIGRFLLGQAGTGPGGAPGTPGQPGSPGGTGSNGNPGTGGSGGLVSGRRPGRGPSASGEDVAVTQAGRMSL